MFRSERAFRLLFMLMSGLAFVLSVVSVPGTAMAGDRRVIAVIVHPGNPVQSLDSDQIAYLFLRKAKAFPGGVMAKPVLMPEDSAARTRFEREILRKEPLQIRAYWARLVFTGRGRPPKSMPSVVDVKRYVASEPAAISYIPDTEVDATVKVLYRLR